jgi:phosphatidylglycerophosphate synthase
MQLHRAAGNDWDRIPPSQQNVWQRMAVRTGGFCTPGNAITILGGLVVASGLVLLAAKQNTWLAVALLLSGRLMDLLDGWLADRTGTKSPVGEAFDATVDKLELLSALLVIWLGSMIPDVVFAVLLLHAAYNSILSLIAYFQRLELHPARSGKLAAALEWLAIGLFVADAGRKLSGNWHVFVAGAAWTLFVIIIGLALVSSAGYNRQLGAGRGEQ